MKNKKDELRELLKIKEQKENINLKPASVYFNKTKKMPHEKTTEKGEQILENKFKCIFEK